MRPIAISLPLASLLVFSGCSPSGRNREHDQEARPIDELRSVELQSADSAQIQIEMGAGELRIEPGSGTLLDADFHYAPASLKPEVAYNVSAGRGHLSVRQPSLARAGFTRNKDSRWELRLNDKVPMELSVQLGAGNSLLKLAGLALTRLHVGIGAGEVEVDLNGPWNKDLDAEISGGVGQCTIRLPRDVGVRVKASGGLGEIKTEGLRNSGGYWINDAHGNSPLDLRLEVSGGIGQINLIG